MRIEVLWTGDELLDGRVQEANTQTIATLCANAGHRVHRVQILGDDLEALVDALQETLVRADLLILGGGLGPTDDDRTRDAVARATGAPLQDDPAAAERIRVRYAARKRPVQASTLRQARFPVGAQCVLNPCGTADGWFQRVGFCTLVVLPGVPSEFRAMAFDAISPHLPSREAPFSEQTIYGLGEAESVSLLAHATEGLRVETLWCVNMPYVRVRFRGEDAHHPQIRSRLAADLHTLLLDEGSSEWSQSLLSAMRSSGETLSTAESCTGGAICNAMTDLPGASAVVMQGWCTYANEAKIRELGVPRDTLASVGAVSEAVARAMAQGARARAATTWALSTTGIAGPDGGTPTRPVGWVWIGVAGPDGTWAAHFDFPGRDRAAFKVLVTSAALWLLHHLRQGTVPTPGKHPNLRALLAPASTR